MAPKLTFLKKASQMAKPGSVKFWLHKHLSGFDPARSHKVIHASELTKDGGFCPRDYALRDVTKAKGKDRWLTTSERMTFQIGRDQERNIVLWFAEMGKAICHWKCVACGTMHYFQLKPERCNECGVRVFDPVEVRFESAINGASCGIDMLVQLGGKKLTPVELKTMDKEEFKALKAPLAEHKWRTTFYLRLIAESTQPWSNLVDTSEGRVLYISKGGYGCMDDEPGKWGMTDKFSPFKEYTIKRDDELTIDLHERAKVVTDFRAGTVGMPCGICPTAMSKRATHCPSRAACFSGEYPAEYDWMSK